MDNDWKILNQVPFADHNAMLDPSCPDITGRVLECLAPLRHAADHAAVDAGIRYLLMHAGKRWQLVRALGRELHLRHVSRYSRTCRPGRLRAHAAIDTARRRIPPRHSKSGWRMGRKLRQLQGKSNSCRGKHRFADRLGAARPGFRWGGAFSPVFRGLAYLLETQRPDGHWDET